MMIYDNKIKFINESNQIHNNRYDYSKVNYINASTPVTIICPVHGEFEQKPMVHKNLKGNCPKCSGGVLLKQDKVIEQFNKKHNNRYDYSKVNYINNLTEVTIICPVHGEFKQLPKTHKRGQGCPKCNGGVSITNSDFRILANKVHTNKYDYSKVKYVNAHTNVVITCPIHGDFEQTPNNHTNINNKSGCPSCGEIIRVEKKKNAHNDMIILIKDTHGDRYKLDKFVYNGYSKESTFICDKHGEFKKVFSDIIKGQGCPLCAKEEGWGTSKEEKSLYSEIKSFYNLPILSHQRDIIPPYELDFYFPEHKLAIEYCGIYFHSEINGNKSKQYHLLKHNLCASKGIRLLTIFSDEWMFKPEIVLQKIKNQLKCNKHKVYARQCTIDDISLIEAKEFLNKYHIQGASNAKYNIGLKYNNILVGVMTFSKPSISKGKYTNTNFIELVRFATSTNIVGGGSKLLTYFERKYKPTKIISYCDIRWGTGNLYRKLGFYHSHNSPPNYWYIDHTKRIHRFVLRKNKNDDPVLTEWENRQLQGWDRIWDCGNMVFYKTF